ncbi:molecular chaperone DnaJ [Candidatus Woesearchaeota archaeon]|nr:molecular chaperone DnaJ [Candidatus Woesearchaeota archaeon]
MAKDYYKILGVDKESTKQDIKKAYKRLAKKHHPDLNKEEGAADKFKEINEAAAVLGDDNKRQQYDQFGSAGGFNGNFSGSDFSDFMSDAGGFGFDFGNIFDTFFGGRNGFSRRPRKGSDLRYDLQIELEDAAFGAEKEIYVTRTEQCKKCDGTGAKNKSDIKTCDACEGTGYRKETRRTAFGIFQTTSVCNECKGKGQVITEECAECNGTGRVERDRKIKVKVPEGIETGTSLRVSGEGEAGEGGPGDLYVVIHVKEHKIFDRDGEDIYLNAPLNFVQAALGDSIEIPTLEGKAELKIPAGTQTNTLFRMKEKGLPHLHGYGSGDQMVRVIVQVPEKLSKKQKELLKEFGKDLKDKNKSFFSKIKDAF